jgi:hypothetical protein
VLMLLFQLPTTIAVFWGVNQGENDCEGEELPRKQSSRRPPTWTSGWNTS